MPLISVSLPPRAPAENPPLLILLHGLASDEQDLIGLAPELDPKLHVVSLRAPYETGYGGYCWFRIEFLPNGRRLIDEAQASASRDLLADEIEAIRAKVSPCKLILGGFSQGAMMAAGVLFEHPEALDAVWLMSGRYVPSLDSGAPSTKPVPVLAQHGRFDDVLRVEEGRELAEILTQRGFAVEFKEYPMAHQISQESLQDARAWMSSLSL